MFREALLQKYLITTNLTLPTTYDTQERRLILPF